ncbi:hypothetical protein QTN25_008814 [Entamoeba marina]
MNNTNFIEKTTQMIDDKRCFRDYFNISYLCNALAYIYIIYSGGSIYYETKIIDPMNNISNFLIVKILTLTGEIDYDESEQDINATCTKEINRLLFILEKLKSLLKKKGIYFEESDSTTSKDSYCLIKDRIGLTNENNIYYPNELLGIIQMKKYQYIIGNKIYLLLKDNLKKIKNDLVNNNLFLLCHSDNVSLPLNNNIHYVYIDVISLLPYENMILTTLLNNTTSLNTIQQKLPFIYHLSYSLQSCEPCYSFSLDDPNLFTFNDNENNSIFDSDTFEINDKNLCHNTILLNELEDNSFNNTVIVNDTLSNLCLLDKSNKDLNDFQFEQPLNKPSMINTSNSIPISINQNPPPSDMGEIFSFSDNFESFEPILDLNF